MTRLRLTTLLIGLLALSAGTAQSSMRAATRTATRTAIGTTMPMGASLPPEVMGEIVLAGGGVSMNQAIAMVEKRFKARVVRSDVRQEGDRRIYVLRLLDDSGNGKVVRVDASSGAIL